MAKKITPQQLKKIYTENKALIEKVTSLAVDKLYNNIENFEEDTTMQKIELCEDLIARYCRGGYKSLNKIT